MSPCIRRLLAALCLLALAAVPIAAAPGGDPSQRLDAQGDPLPDGALARHGTIRLRHNGEIALIGFAPDGKSVLSLGFDQTFRKWEVATGKEQWRMEKKGMAMAPNGRVMSERMLLLQLGGGGKQLIRDWAGPEGGGLMVSHSADGRILAWVDARNAVNVIDTATGKTLRRIELKDPAGHAVAISADGKLLAVAEAGGEDHYVRLWDLVNDKELPQMALTRQRMVTKLFFSPDGKLLAGISNAQVRVWDVTTGKRIRLYEGHENIIFAAAFSRDGQFLVTAAADGTVRLWETSSEEEVKKFTLNDNQFMSVAFTPNGKHVIAGSQDKNVHIWNLATEQEKILQGHAGPVTGLAVSPDSTTLAACDATGAIRIWDLASGEERLGVKQPERLNGVGLRDGGKTLVMWAASGKVRHVDALNGIERATAKAPPEENLVTEVSPDGKVAAIWNREEDGLKIWDGLKGVELHKLTGHPGGTFNAVFSPDSQCLATTGADNAVRVWKVANGKELFQIANVNGGVMAFSPDGKLLAMIAQDDELCLFETATGKERCRLKASSGGGMAMIFSPNSKFMALCVGDEVVRLWDVIQGKVLRGFVGHQGSVNTASFAPTGDIMATGGADGTVRLWNVQTGEQVHSFEGHQGPVQRVAYAADGKTLISVGADQCVLVWDPASRGTVKVGAQVAKKLDHLWMELANDDGMASFQAMGELIGMPKDAVKFLATKLQPVPKVEAALIEQLVADLDNKNFTTRQKASKDLEKLEGLARPALEKALAKPPSAEAQARVKKLLERLDGPVTAPDELRMIRAVEVLERIGTAEARDLLGNLAKGAAGARLTREATESLARLTK